MGHKYVKEDDTFNTSQNGVVPKPTAQDITNNKFLRADGSWASGAGGSVVSADQIVSSGTEIGGVTVDGARTAFYAPYHNYSTAEQVVGTWIDGKPLYEQTFTHTCASNREVITLNPTYVIKKADGGVFNSSEKDFIPFGYYVNSNDFVRYYTADNYFVIENGYYSSRPKAIVTIRYTKITD